MSNRIFWTRLLTQNTVTVARHGGRTLLTDRAVLWDVDALSSITTPAPDTEHGHYSIKGSVFTPIEEPVTRTSAEDLSAVFDARSNDFESAPEATLTEWSVNGFRIVVTRDGRALRVNGRVAGAVHERLQLRATDEPGQPLGVFLPTPGGPGETVWRFVGAVQPLSDDVYYAAVFDAITEVTLAGVQRIEEMRSISIGGAR
jgi:hypothetical protein